MLLPWSPVPTLAEALASPDVVLAAVQAAWNSTSLPSSAAPFSLTLSGASPIVLRSAVPAFGPNATVSVGGVACNLTAMSADRRWLAFISPHPRDICPASSDSSSCGYVPISVTNPPWDSHRGATLSCPPFCSGSLGAGSGIVPLTSSYAGPFSPAVISASTSVATPLTAADYARGSTAGVSLVYPSGVFYTAGCTGLFTDPASGACANASDPASANCAFGSGINCRPCPSQTLCPGGYRCWPLPGRWVVAESTDNVLPCAEPGSRVRCAGWSAALSATMCGEGYLQVIWKGRLVVSQA